MAREGFFSEADCQSVYEALLVEMGSVLIDNFIISGRQSSSSMSQQRRADISSGELNDPMAGLKNATKLVVHPEFRVEPDILLKSTGKIFLVVGMKKPSLFRSAVDGDIPDLVEAYRRRDCESLDQQRSHVLVQPIVQLFRYLVVHEVGWEIISSADLTYFVRREGDSLRISEGIHWCHADFIAALAYTMETAAGDKTEYVWRRGGKCSQDFDVDDSRGTQDQDSQGTSSERDKSKKLKLTPTELRDRRVTRSMTGRGGLKETPAGHLHLGNHAYATGWSGNIVRGTYEGHAVLVKLAPVCSDRAEALINEASAYLKLQKHWGKHVAALISHGTTADGTVVYIATELIKGFEFGIER